MDDDHDGPLIRYPSVSFQGLTGANHPKAHSPFMHEQMFRRESKGTGVFIPKSSQQPRRKHGGGRYRSSLSSKSNRHLHQTTAMASQPSLINNFFKG
ncbi:hypothetical protein F3Y22_tig00110013pilonHSYRG00517 [Hibiscus syriacus]|uniref:Uncharacterized protein n=1 Tax=Hibiscus syriacus TaxID=106335 RepID=A0A6A3BQ97_HIBSY|nr:hypothetical protein F3Y22_tig00110013pilonHSYRG00517 [Hibiscus syriacus]